MKLMPYPNFYTLCLYQTNTHHVPRTTHYALHL